MAEVERFDFWALGLTDPSLFARPDGAWVRHFDYEKLENDGMLAILQTRERLAEVEAERDQATQRERERVREAIGEVRKCVERLRALDPERRGLNRDGHCTAKASAYENAAEILEAALNPPEALDV